MDMIMEVLLVYFIWKPSIPYMFENGGKQFLEDHRMVLIGITS